MSEAIELHSQEIFRLSPSEMLTADRSKAFLTDNRTAQAQEKREKWLDHFRNEGIIVAMLCSDARERSAFPPDEIIDLSTIAASGPTEPYARMLNYPGTRAFVNASHYDSDKWTPGTMLLGCGGLGAREQVEKGGLNHHSNGGLEGYIEEDIRHKDAVYNAIKNGAITATNTSGIPVLAAVHDHKYGVLTPLAVFQGNTTISEVAMGDLLDPKRYDPKQLYGSEDGTLQIPTLEENSLPDVFKEFLEKQKKHIATLQEIYPNLPEILAEQNPYYLIITTEKIPARIRYPHILNDPGVFFQIHIPKGKNETGIQIDNAAIQRAVAQAEYPIDHANFSNLHTIIIETGDLHQSKEIAKALKHALRYIPDDTEESYPYDDHSPNVEPHKRSNRWLSTWLSNKDNKILLAQTSSGKSTQITEFDLFSEE